MTESDSDSLEKDEVLSISKHASDVQFLWTRLDDLVKSADHMLENCKVYQNDPESDTYDVFYAALKRARETLLTADFRPSPLRKPSQDPQLLIVPKLGPGDYLSERERERIKVELNHLSSRGGIFVVPLNVSIYQNVGGKWELLPENPHGAILADEPAKDPGQAEGPGPPDHESAPRPLKGC
jgi:hypothetical protein